MSSDYNFFPDTYILPYEMNLFKSQFYKKEEVKPPEDEKEKE